jgi:hypothetical protein
VAKIQDHLLNADDTILPPSFDTSFKIVFDIELS